MKFRKNVKLAEYTTFKIGGTAEYFCAVENKEDLIKAVSFAKKEKLPFFVLGGGSNLLVADNGFNGLVIKIGNHEFEIKTSKVIAGAGLDLAKLLSITANAGLSGLEWCAGIPGVTIGGAIRGNAGAFGTEMKDIVKKVEALDTHDLNLPASRQGFKIYNSGDCKFGYRNSIFKENDNLIIWSCEFALKNENKERVMAKAREILDYRMAKHPKFPSAGSIFKNLDNIKARDLIERAGLNGKKVGGAEISEQHANFIINTGGAKAKDVLALIDLVKKEVKNKFGLEIEEEIKILS